jgi:hypothetical protein
MQKEKDTKKMTGKKRRKIKKLKQRDWETIFEGYAEWEKERNISDKDKVAEFKEYFTKNREWKHCKRLKDGRCVKFGEPDCEGCFFFAKRLEKMAVVEAFDIIAQFIMEN